MDRKIALNEAEADLALEAIRRLLDVKRKALDQSTAAELPYTSADFGVPALEALAERFSATYEAEDAPERDVPALQTFGGMTKSQLDRLDALARHLKAGATNATDGLSTGERLYVRLAAGRLSPDWTIAEALYRVGEADTAALIERWRREG